MGSNPTSSAVLFISSFSQMKTYNFQLFQEAVRFAHEKHLDQTRKQSNIPYLVHPLRVSCRLLELGYSFKVAIAAILHDTLEDTQTTTVEIEELFTAEVKDMVVQLSEEEHPLPRKASWKIRKQATLNKALNLNPDCLAILCADKLDNLESSARQVRLFGHEALFQGMNADYEQQRWYYFNLLRIFLDRNQEFQSQILIADFKLAFETVFPPEPKSDFPVY